jgi:DNA gyrase inhibitor GyrI
MRMLWIITAIVAIGALAVAWGLIVSNVEQPKYNILESYGAIEIRDYETMVVAEAEVKGKREESINEGFRIIADYIFGNNVSKQKVAMTAPVTQQQSEKISMTAPVTQQITDSGSWKVHFIMPSSYTIETLPKPKNDAVKLKKITAKRYAVLRFSGIGSSKKLETYTSNLKKFIDEKKLKPISAPIFAFFNPPWTVPFLRRNEVMIEIEK